MGNADKTDFGPGTLRAGVAKSEITTHKATVRVNDPLYAKAMVLDDGNTRLAIITMDTTAIAGRAVSAGYLQDGADDFMPKLRSWVREELDIPGCNIMVTASHTHKYHKLLCDDDQQMERTCDALSRAVDNMVPVTIGVGTGYENTISINRNLRLKNGRDWCIRTCNPCPPDEELEALGPIDPEIGLIRVDRADGHPLAVVYNFACHPLLGVPRGVITADFPGFASKTIEETMGDGVMALFIQGANGDIAEVLNKDLGRPRNSEEVGTRLALSTLKGLQDIQSKDVSLNIITETIDLPRRTDIPDVIAELEQEQAQLLESLMGGSLNFKTFFPLYLKHLMSPDYPSDYSYRYMKEESIGCEDLRATDANNQRDLDKYIANIHAMERLARIRDQVMTLKKHKKINDEAGSSTIPAEVQGIRIGDCVLITSPAELLVEVGLNLKKASPYQHTFVASNTNGYVHYGAPSADYVRGGYEVTECLLAPAWQEIFETKANEIIRKL